MPEFDLKQQNAKITGKPTAESSAELPGATGATGPTGPRTDAGKERTRLNAYKHGLTGQIHLSTAEEHEAYEKHRQLFLQALAPVGGLEQELAQEIAEDRWRIKRARAMEANIFALGQVEELADDVSQAMAHAKTWLAESKNIQLLTLYQQRIERSIAKNTAALRAMQAERKAAREKAWEQACILAEAAAIKGETYKPETDFPSPKFVFSLGEIERNLSVRWRLEDALYVVETHAAA